MAMSLFRYGFGVTIVGHQAEVMLGPEPRRNSANASEASHSSCGLNGGPSITTGQNQIKIVHWNANGTVSRKWALAHFLKERKVDIFRIQEIHLKKELRVLLRRYQKPSDATEKRQGKEEFSYQVEKMYQQLKPSSRKLRGFFPHLSSKSIMPYPHRPTQKIARLNLN